MTETPKTSSLPPLWSGRPTSGRAGSGCARCEDLRRLLAESSSPPPPSCADCGEFPPTADRTREPNKSPR